MFGYTRAHAGGTPVVVYGNRWCGITQLIRRTLDRAGVPYDYVDLDANPDVHRRLQWMVGGSFRQPLVYVGGRWLEQPSPYELRRALSFAPAA
jgi:mycoredoxin